MKLQGNTPNALLGILSFHPMSGYDIRKLIPESIGHFWSESYGQIYPALKSLTAAGLVKKKSVRRAGKPDRNVYSLTEAGRKQLSTWLAIPIEDSVPRNELMLKLFFGAHAAPAVSRQHVEAYRERHLGALNLYGSMVRKLKEEEVDDPQLPFWLMTLSYGRHVCEATVAWCDETLKKLAGMEKTDASKR
jgi:PadR family transcriptional regulator, regulatory protein AphA